MADPEERLIAKLNELTGRFDELTAQLNDPSVAANPARLMTVSKERSRLERIVLPYRAYLKLADQAAQARALLDEAGGDAELRELAQSDYDESSAKADQALAQGNIDALVKAILQHTEEGIREHFTHALETAKHADESVAAGREYVAAYVTYVHYVEGIAQVVHGAPHHGEAAAPATGHGH